MPSFLATCVAVTVADRIKILIVDDDQGMLESLVIALEDEFELVTARNGQEALDVIGSQPVDVVLLDLMMPILDGEGYLREHNVRHPHTPVLLVSADLDLARRATDLGGLDYLRKPFVLTTLEAKLRRLASSGPLGGGSGGGPGHAASPSTGVVGSSALPKEQARRLRPHPAALHV